MWKKGLTESTNAGQVPQQAVGGCALAACQATADRISAPTSRATKMTDSIRRNFLKSAGAVLTLPMLESLAPASTAASDIPNRLVCIGSYLGYYGPAFFPAETGREYAPSPLLSMIDHHRADYTVFSGFDHRAANGHDHWDNYLCGQQIGSCSLDQMVAEKFHGETRFPSLQLCAGDIPRQHMSYTRQGTPLPMLNRPSSLYQKLFTTADDRQRTEYLLKSGRSALDTLREEAQSLRKKVSLSDQHKLDQYFSSLRELESSMGRQLSHLKEDVAQVEYDLPPYDPIAPTLMLECEQIMLDLLALALQTDATRVATLFIAGLGQVFTLDGHMMRAGYHALSHHGNDPDLIRDLVRVETEHMRCLDRFLSKLKDTSDVHGRPLLDSTVVLFGSGMGDASRHSNQNLPTIVAGGGFQHGQHIAAEREAENPLLLGDVYISILQKMGIERETFSNATRGLNSWI